MLANGRMTAGGTIPDTKLAGKATELVDASSTSVIGRPTTWRPTAFVDTGIIPRTAIPCQILDTSCVQPRTV
jgi:hypothetical protein